jgi:hypothetical protein
MLLRNWPALRGKQINKSLNISLDVPGGFGVGNARMTDRKFGEMPILSTIDEI